MLTDPPPTSPPRTVVPLFTNGQLIQALYDFGEHWQLQQTGEDGMWLAIERPEPRALRVISAPTLASLTEKLRGARQS